MKKQAILLVAAFGALTLTSCGPTSVEVTEQELDAGVKVGLKSEYQITSTATTAMSFTGLGEDPIVTNAQSKTISRLKMGKWMSSCKLPVMIK